MRLPKKVEQSLLDRRNVVGLGFSEEGVVRVFVKEKLPEDKLDPEDIVPKRIDLDDVEFETDVVGTGEPHALSRTDRRRPVPAGVSGGHEAVTAGTIGSPPLTPVRSGGTFILTNAHVAAPQGEARKGDLFVQPGPLDGGTDANVVGRLHDWSYISKEGENRTDSALVRVDDVFMENEVEKIGQVDMLDHEVDLDEVDEFVKSGRTTGVTSGERLETDVVVRVRGYYPDSPSLFVDVDAFEAMSAGGDSGSLIGYKDDEGRFVGTHLLFAGSPYRTIGIPLENVFNAHGELEIANPPSGRSWWRRWIRRGR